MSFKKKSKTQKKPLQALLVERALIPEPELAHALILAGKVMVNDQRVDKPSKLVPQDASIRIREAKKFVSRAGEKLAEALRDLGLAEEIKDRVVLDVGASTGGFSDCCLKLGARTVIALDVGSNQLDWKIRSDPRVICLEKTDIRDFQAARYPKVDWILADISFNSLATLAPAIVSAASNVPNVHFLLLVKPQFELQAQKVPKGGVVVDDKQHEIAIQEVKAAFARLGLMSSKVVAAKIKGKKGNQEFFFYTQS